MAYVSLYRRYRPASFAEVVGQEHVTRTLVNAISEDRVSHAYLFTGPRGTGKTSTARILAKAINCEQGPTPQPCGRCGQCVAIAEGSSVDVIELDMASHGGVDDARELRDRALFAPASARRKVYILDEVHMASTAAFNALLKLIEEPPGHVLFAMATTDPQKVLPTILSRVQRLDLRRVAASEVAAHVRSLCEAEGVTIDADALEAVVRAGDGSVRDTLSVLEQVLAFAGQQVSAEAVAQTLGQTPMERVITTVELIGARDLAGLLGVVQELLDDGHDLRRFTLDLVQHLRDLLVLQAAPDRPDLVDATDERRRRLLAQSDLLARASLLRAVEVLADTVAEQRQGPPRLPLELALTSLVVPGTDGDVAELADRVARLEAALAGGQRPQSVSTSAHTAQAPPTEAQPDPAAPVVEPASGATPPAEPAASSADPPAAAPVASTPAAAAAGAGDDLDTITARWDAVLELLKQGSRRHHAMVEPAVPVSVSRGVLRLRYGRRYASFHAAQARTGELDQAIRGAIETACGLAVKLEVVIEGDEEPRRPQPASLTPDDARTPVLDDRGSGQDTQPAVSPAPEPGDATVDGAPAAADPPDTSTPLRPADGEADEETEVREAEQGAPSAEVDVDALLTSRLDAQLLDELPAARGDR